MKLIFDVGYNRGDFTSKCFEKFPECKSIGVEANPNLAYAAEDTPNVTVLNRLAAREGDDDLEFFIEPDQDGISTASKKFMENSRFSKGSDNLAPHSAEWIPPIMIETITIDEMVEEYGKPDLIKVDVEGYELEVLAGLSHKINRLCFEWHEEFLDEFVLCLEELERIGYKEYGIIGYFVEPDKIEGMTYSPQGDPYMVEPESYLSREELLDNVRKVCYPERRINYGMLWAK